MHRTVGVGIHKNPKHFLPPSGKLNFFWSKWLHLKTEELRKCYSLTSSKICLWLRPAISKFLSERINRIISRIPEPTSQDQLTYFTGRSPFIGKVSKSCALFVINRLLVLTTLTLLNGKLKSMKCSNYPFILWFKSFWSSFIHTFWKETSISAFEATND